MRFWIQQRAGADLRAERGRLNKDRFVWGLLFQECGWEPEPGCWNSPPFGNWGVDSNYGQRQDTNQFEGWKPKGAQYQWNSCTAYYPPPNPDYYNWNNYTQQRDRYTTNPHGTKGVALAVSCPRDTNGDGICDQGGCKEIYSYSEGTNWMSLYELDPFNPLLPWCGIDDHVETLYFPATAVYLSCTVGYCYGGGSPWYSPTSGWVTSVQLAMVVNFGVYQDSVFCEHLRSRDPSYRCTW